MDGLCFKAGVSGFSSPISLSGGIDGKKQAVQVSALERSVNGDLRMSFVDPLRSVWPDGGGKESSVNVSLDEANVEEEQEEEEEEEEEEGRGNWVLKILQIRSVWRERAERRSADLLEKRDELDEPESGCCSCDDGDSEACVMEEEEFDRTSFSRFLRRVSLDEAVLYARMSYLGHLAYSIPKIKPGNLLKNHGLRFVTSSMEKRAQSMNIEKEQTSTQVLETEDTPKETEKEDNDPKKTNNYRISASAAYQIAASAASYLQHRTRSILPFKPSKFKTEELEEQGNGTNGSAEIGGSEPASFVATTNSLTAVVAAEEEMKQAIAHDLNSVHLSPCQWFICDDVKSGTRIFVIQGSESLASWQANLLFEPIQFEGLDVLVHRGIYEAAKGIYEQILPEVLAHLQARDSATFQLTGHSLGGSLSLLISLMLLIRGEVHLSSLLPIVTFGAPTIMCGGDLLLRRLGVPRNHVQSITMHRDIVPRAFACNYPNRVVELLKAINSNFRNHPCLSNRQKLLYAPMGELLILQPHDKISPHHDLLPLGVGLYHMTCSLSDSDNPETRLRAAQTVFLNSPHPLEILSDRSAYGSTGAICRDHDMKSYLRAVRSVICQELNRLRKEKEHHRQVWWPLISSRSVHANLDMSGWMGSSNANPHMKLSAIFQTGTESLKRFSRLIALWNMHLFMVLLFPTRVSLLPVHTIISFH